MQVKFTRFETLNRANYEAFQKKVLPRQEDADITHQLEFIEVLEEGGEKFVEKLLELGTVDGEIPPVPVTKLDADEALEVPWSTEVELANLWRELAPFQAALPELWARFTLELIRCDKIEHMYLAKRPGEDGRSRVVRLLRTGGDNLQHRKEINSLIRDVLRRSGGIYRDRGKRTAYIDCPIAKSWWRHRFASEAVSSDLDLSIEQLSNILRRKSNLWQELIQAMVSRLTVIGATQIRDAIVQFIATECVNRRVPVKQLLNEVGIIAAVQALPAMSGSQLVRLLQNEIWPKLEDITDIE